MKIQILLLIFLLVSAAILLVKHLRPPSPRGYTRRFDRAPSRKGAALGFAPLSTDIDHGEAGASDGGRSSH